MLGLPGGRVGAGDNSPAETAQRQVREEAGLDLGSSAFFPVQHSESLSNGDNSSNKVQLYVVDLDRSRSMEAAATDAELECGSADSYVDTYGGTAAGYGHFWVPLKNLHLLRNASNGLVPHVVEQVELAEEEAVDLLGNTIGHAARDLLVAETGGNGTDSANATEPDQQPDPNLVHHDLDDEVIHSDLGDEGPGTALGKAPVDDPPETPH
jgi:8-oxo-dGTP pyrophosphatase MutT (NUDIX family)